MITIIDFDRAFERWSENALFFVSPSDYIPGICKYIPLFCFALCIFIVGHSIESVLLYLIEVNIQIFQDENRCTNNNNNIAN